MFFFTIFRKYFINDADVGSPGGERMTFLVCIKPFKKKWTFQFWIRLDVRLLYLQHDWARRLFLMAPVSFVRVARPAKMRAL